MICWILGTDRRRDDRRDLSVILHPPLPAVKTCTLWSKLSTPPWASGCLPGPLCPGHTEVGNCPSCPTWACGWAVSSAWNTHPSPLEKCYSPKIKLRGHCCKEALPDSLLRRSE